MAAIIYPNAADHINNHPYEVLLPPHALDVVSELGVKRPPVTKINRVDGGLSYKIKTTTPTLQSTIYEPFDSNLKQRSRITIARMVTLMMSQTEFTIATDYDVLEILHQIDSYVAENFPLYYQPAIKEYFEKILKLRARIYAMFLRVLNRHPQWKQAYSHDQGVFGFIRRLYQPLNIDFKLPMTPIEELAICPTVRENPEVFSGLSSAKQESNPGVMSGKIIYSV